MPKLWKFDGLLVGSLSLYSISTFNKYGSTLLKVRNTYGWKPQVKGVPQNGAPFVFEEL